MDYQEAIKTLQDIHDVAESRIKSGDKRGVVYIPADKLQDIAFILRAMQELEQYHQLGTLEELEQLKENNFSGAELAGIACAINQLQKYEQLGTLDEVRAAVEEHRRSMDDLK